MLFKVKNYPANKVSPVNKNGNLVENSLTYLVFLKTDLYIYINI